MKYEISQQQYVDFLNNLSSSNATDRFPNSLTSRNGISVGTGSSLGIYSTSSPSVACNFLSWADLAAYLDWSGLRPMTELEFEKICRGTSLPIVGEYAWGNTAYTSATGFVNGGLPNESVLNAGANVCLTGTTGPLRVGIFAGTNTTRAQAGATFYGAMEYSGNIYERAISLSIAEGRLFTGIHGDGTISATGLADVLNWPANTTGNGVGIKGGAWIDVFPANLGVSERQFMLVTAHSGRLRITGGRGVRTAP
jgi:formylglycine-generating enzyme required for sulfatase activity